MPHLRDGLERLSTLSPEAIKERTFETLRQMSLRGSRQRPLILAVEDLHWLDRTSEDLFAEAEARFDEARRTFTSIQSPLELGRTHLAIAELKQTQGDREAAATHLGEAYCLFSELRVSRHVEHAERLARDFGVVIANQAGDQ